MCAWFPKAAGLPLEFAMNGMSVGAHPKSVCGIVWQHADLLSYADKVSVGKAHWDSLEISVATRLKGQLDVAQLSASRG